MFSGTGSNIQPLLSHSVLAAPSGVLSIYLILLRAVEILPVYVTFCYCSVLWDRIKYTASPLTFCSGCTVWCIIYISHFVACSRDPTCLCNILLLQCSQGQDQIYSLSSHILFWLHRLVYYLYISFCCVQ